MAAALAMKNKASTAVNAINTQGGGVSSEAPTTSSLYSTTISPSSQVSRASSAYSYTPSTSTSSAYTYTPSTRSAYYPPVSSTFTSTVTSATNTPSSLVRVSVTSTSTSSFSSSSSSISLPTISSQGTSGSGGPDNRTCVANQCTNNDRCRSGNAKSTRTCSPGFRVNGEQCGRVCQG